jgi:hypothetical protein
MYSPTGSIIVLMVSSLAQAQPSAATPAVHPSNGVLELSAKPLLGHDRRPLSSRHEVYLPWGGLVEITIRNVSHGVAVLDEIAAAWEFRFEILDSAGQPVARTELGKRVIDASREGAVNVGLASRFQLVPMQATTLKIDLSNYFKIEPGHAYKVTVRRSEGFPAVDEAGKPLKEVEASCSFDVPDYGLLRSQ